MMNIAHLVVMMADSTSETWCELANDASSLHPVLYRSEIDVALAEMSHMWYLGPLAPPGAYVCSSVLGP